MRPGFTFGSVPLCCLSVISLENVVQSVFVVQLKMCLLQGVSLQHEAQEGLTLQGRHVLRGDTIRLSEVKPSSVWGTGWRESWPRWRRTCTGPCLWWQTTASSTAFYCPLTSADTHSGWNLCSPTPGRADCHGYGWGGYRWMSAGSTGHLLQGCRYFLLPPVESQGGFVAGGHGCSQGLLAWWRKRNLSVISAFLLIPNPRGWVKELTVVLPENKETLVTHACQLLLQVLKVEFVGRAGLAHHLRKDPSGSCV